MSGWLILNDLGELIGELLLHENRREFLQFLRQGGLVGNFVVLEVYLPRLINNLIFGKFQKIDYAQAYGRLLRQELYKHLSERDVVLDIEHLERLSNEFSMCNEELSESFLELFNEAVAESVDSLDISGITREESAETVVGNWLENLDKIETYLGHSVDSTKRFELESFLHAIEWEVEIQRENHREEHSLNRSSSIDAGLPEPVPPPSGVGQADDGFSRYALNSMFSSLKK